MTIHTKPGWKKHYRAIHSKWPPINIFDTELEGDDILLFELESETSDRLQNWREFIRHEDFKSGNGWGAIIASFCYARNGRFSIANQLGAYYCANSEASALSEWSYHATKVWRDMGFTGDASATVRCYTGSLLQSMVDVRKDEQMHLKDNYAPTQAFAIKAFEQEEFGILYRSVRNPGGECCALLRPTASSPVKQAAHFSVLWNGECFTQYGKVGRLIPLPNDNIEP